MRFQTAAERFGDVIKEHRAAAASTPMFDVTRTT
jgi:hypothetical protein